MKRLSILAFIAVFAVLLFTGCEREEDATVGLRLRETGSEGVITFKMWGDPEERVAVYRVLQAFQKEHDIGIKVVHSDSLSYSDKLQAMFAGGTPPDVFYLHIQDFYNYSSRGLLYPLDEFARDPSFDLEDFYPELLKAFTFGDSLYGIPKDWTTFVLYYNMDLFDEAGVEYPNAKWTWDDFLQAAQKLTRDKTGDGIIDQYGILIETWADWYNVWVYQNNGKIFDEDGNWVFARARYLDNNAQAIQFLGDMINKYRVAPDIATALQLGNYESFMNGRAAMCMYGRWAMLHFKDIRNFRWDYSVPPKNKRQATSIVAVSLAISSETKNPDAAWKLIEFVTSYEGQVFTAEAGLAVPSRRSLVNSESYLKAPEVILNQPHLAMNSSKEDPFIQALDFAVWVPANPYWLEIRAKLDEQLEDVFLGNRDAKSVILRVDTVVNDIIAGAEIEEMIWDEE